MDALQLKILLHRSEGDALDFKSKQYPYSGASEEEKSELLKDIIAIANAWKDSDGHILIGVEEENGCAKRICGASTTLKDSDVQQFVNSKTHRPVSFRVIVTSHEGLDITVIQIDKSQDRPVFLKKDFGKLKRNIVYIRRGSATVEADPVEIADMGKEAVRIQHPEVSLEFEFEIQVSRNEINPLYSDSKIELADWLNIYAVNKKGGLAENIQGAIWVPALILYELVGSRVTAVASTPKDIAKGELEKIDVNNNKADRPQAQFAKPLPPDWRPISPGMRFRLKSLRLFPYREMLQLSPCSIPWQLSVNGSDLIKGETKFSEIPLIDKRKVDENI